MVLGVARSMGAINMSADTLPTSNRKPTINEIATSILRAVPGIGLGDLQSANKSHSLMRVRYLIARAARDHGHRFSNIGKRLGRHPTTVRSLLNRSKFRLKFGVESQAFPTWDGIREDVGNCVGIEEISDMILSKFENLSIINVRSDYKSDANLCARYLIARAARNLGYSFPQIGRHLCKHHTTIMYLLYESKAAERFGSNAKARG